MNTKHMVAAISAVAFIAMSGIAHARAMESGNAHWSSETRSVAPITVGNPVDAFGAAMPSDEPVGRQYHGGPKSDF
jgi:hypothetical protein